MAAGPQRGVTDSGYRPTTSHGEWRDRLAARRHALATPSGRIELFSPTVAGYGYPDCPGHPAWLEPDEWLGGPRARRFPLHLIANQPATRLHSQLDVGRVSQQAKVAGREAIWLHPADAAAGAIRDGDVIRVFNDRGACLAGAVLCAHGNPNVLTPACPDPACRRAAPASTSWSRRSATRGSRRRSRWAPRLRWPATSNDQGRSDEHDRRAGRPAGRGVPVAGSAGAICRGLLSLGRAQVWSVLTCFREPWAEPAGCDQLGRG